MGSIGTLSRHKPVKHARKGSLKERMGHQLGN